MTNIFKVALAGYNAFTDTNPDHFSLYVDGTTDHILIKEKLRGTQSVGASSNVNIAHNLSYVPMCFVFAEVSAGVWRRLYSQPVDSAGLYFTVNSTNLVLVNQTGSSITFSYYIFYDNIT